MNPKIYDLMTNPDYYVTTAVNQSIIQSNLENYKKIKKNLNSMCIYDIKCQNTSIHFFGSRIFGLGHENSDLDIFIDLDHNYYSSENKKLDANRLHMIKNVLDNNWVVQVFIPDASVPLLKVKYLPLDLDCDIIVSNGLGVKNSELINHLFNIQKEARSLFHFIRMCLNANDLRFKSYTLTLLVIFFLQNRNLMPSVRRVQHNLDKNYIDKWNVSFDNQKDITCYGTRKLRKYKNQITNFFVFYASYDFNQNVISTFFGKSIRRSDYPSTIFKLDKPMCIAGPINYDYNCSYDVGNDRLEKFQLICKDCAKIFHSCDF